MVIVIAVALAGQTSDNPALALMVSLTGPLATANRESRQARKGATVVVMLCAEVWLVGVTAIFTALMLSFRQIVVARELLVNLPNPVS